MRKQKHMTPHLPKTSYPRIVIIGAGFGGLKLARKLAKQPYQVVLLDRNNFHQFQPLFYQVATSGIAPSAIAFPVRKIFHNVPNVHFRMAEVNEVKTEQKLVVTDIGEIDYDYLVIATGADTNYFGIQSIQENALPMKSVQESLALRNQILQRIEEALVSSDDQSKKECLTIVIVGGGPTGTEVAGALAEMKRFVLPKDYPELNFDEMDIYLLEAGGRLLAGMSEKSGKASKSYLEEKGVIVRLNAMVESYDGHIVKVKDGEEIRSRSLIWAAGIKGNEIKGLEKELYKANARLVTDDELQVKGLENVFAIGDVSLATEEKFPKGHPQVAQVAIQQGEWLADYFIAKDKGKSIKKFSYKDLGSMATIGRSKAVVDLPIAHFRGFIAWLFWLFVHLMNILGVKNRFFIFIDWMWYYIKFDQNLRLVIKQKSPNPKG